MTDTPRTEAELLSIFADNNTGAITPQDMRDFVVSSSFGPGSEQVGYFGTRGISVSLATDTEYNPPMVHSPTDETDGYYYDPEGWLQSSALAPGDDWYGDGMAAYTWLLLPPGQYIVNAYSAWTASGFTTGNLWLVGGDSRDPSLDTPGVDPWAGYPSYALANYDDIISPVAGIPILFGNLRQMSLTHIRVLESTGPQKFAVAAVRQSSGSNQTLVFVSVNVMRIGAGG